MSENISIMEASKILGCTKMTIYNHIKRDKTLKKHIVIQSNIQHLTLEGLSVFKSLITESKSKPCIKSNVIQSNIQDDIQPDILNPLLIAKDKHIDTLETQLKEKDKQLNALTDALNQSQKLNENNQVLLQQTQQKVFLLEEYKHEQPHWWKRIFS